MKKKLIFSGMVLLALVLTSGTFAYTYVGFAGSTPPNVTLADAVMTTYEPSAEQPDWDEVLPEGEYRFEILFPNAAGDATELPTQYPAEGEHWDKVSEYTPDDGATYVSTLTSRHWERDLYGLTYFLGWGGDETITNVTVYFRFAAGGNYDARAMAEIKTGGKAFSGDTETHHGTEFVTMSHSWEVNPNTGEPWTRDEVNNLQAGVTMRGDDRNSPALCTQVYVLVNYEIVVIEGALPTGGLYDITPHPEYTGDMLVKIYLTNTADLLKAYQYINMKVYTEYSVEAEKDPNYQILSLETGVVLFNIEGGSAETYTVELSGGSYRLNSNDSDDWSEGWTVVPELYCEVTQR